MTTATKPGWERFGDAMLDWGGYLLLAFGTLLAISAGNPEAIWRLTTLAIALGAAALMYVLYTRRIDHRSHAKFTTLARAPPIQCVNQHRALVTGAAPIVGTASRSSPSLLIAPAAGKDHPRMLSMNDAALAPGHRH